MKKFYNENAVAITVFFLMLIFSVLLSSIIYNLGVRSIISNKENLYYIEFYNTIISGMSFIFSVAISYFIFLNYQQTKKQMNIYEINHILENRPWLDFEIQTYNYLILEEKIRLDLKIKLDNIGKSPAYDVIFGANLYVDHDPVGAVVSATNSLSSPDSVLPTILMGKDAYFEFTLFFGKNINLIDGRPSDLDLMLVVHYRNGLDKSEYKTAKSFAIIGRNGEALEPPNLQIKSTQNAFGEEIYNLLLTESNTRRDYR